MGYAPHKGDVDDRIGEGAPMRLGNVSDLAGESPGADTGDLGPFVRDPAAQRLQHAEHYLDERTLPASVGTEQRHDLALSDCETDVLEDRPVSIRKRHAVQADKRRHQLQPLLDFLSTTAKKGTPMSEVAMPTGISTLKSSLDMSSTTIR